MLQKFNIPTAVQFAKTPEARVQKLLTKPGLQTWQELNGIPAIEFAGKKVSYQSIGKTKTFTPPSNDKDFVYAQLIKNVENACMKARRYHQGATKIIIYIRRHDFKELGIVGKVERATAYPNDLIPALQKMFNAIWQPDKYRATGIILSGLVPLNPSQPTLFEDPSRLVKMRQVYGAIDSLRAKYGKHTIHLGASLVAQSTQHLSSRGDITKRSQLLIKGETKRRRLPIPMLQVQVK